MTAHHTTTATPATALQTFLHGDRFAKLSELDELLHEPEFAASSPSTARERNLRTYARLAAVGRHEGGSLALAGDVRRLFTVQEWMAVVDPCLFHAALVHFAVCTWTIRELSRPGAELAELTDELDPPARGGHDPHHRGRPQQQPHRRRHAGALRRGLAHVHAQHPRRRSREDHGERRRARRAEERDRVRRARRRRAALRRVPVRDAHPDCGGTRAGRADLGAVRRGGDTAGLRARAICRCRVPFDSWLCDSASLAPDGTFEDPLDRPGERLVRSLSFSAHAALGAGVGLAAAARASVTVALRTHASA